MGTRDSLRGLLRNRDFGFYVGVRVATMLGQSIQAAAVMWQVYDLSGSPVALAFVGIARFVPSLAISVLAGAIADTHDRRAVLALAQLSPLGTSAALWALTATGHASVPVIYACMAILGVTVSFEAPARQTLLPLVVPRESFQRAVAMATTVQQVASIFGPAGAGLAIAQSGVAPAYLMHVGLVLGGLVCIACIRIREADAVSGRLDLGMMKEGIHFIWSNRPVLGAMALDMFAVIFAGADALLPIYARDVLGVGAFGYGLLTSSKAVGALITAVGLSLSPPVRATGRTLMLMVTIYGAATIAFGLSTWFPLSLILYGLTAAADQVSVVMRQTIIQLDTPNALRGRVSAVNQVFVGASNQLGATESGLVAAWANSAVFAVVSGGVGCLATVALILVLIPSLWRHTLQPRVESPVPVA